MPPAWHVSLIVATLQRKNFMVPLHCAAPTMFSRAESWTIAKPLMSKGKGPVEPFWPTGVVFNPAAHCCRPPRTKSLSVAAVDVDERVSERTLEKHWLATPRTDRLIPPSKHSPLRAPLLAVPLLSRNGQGIVSGFAFTIPQKASPGPAAAQLAAFALATVRRFVSAQLGCGLPAATQAVSHLSTVIVELPPPFEKSLMISRSPLACAPVKLKPPPTLWLPRPIGFWKSQKPCCASPLLS